jgi:hypothetical protein
MAKDVFGWPRDPGTARPGPPPTTPRHSPSETIPDSLTGQAYEDVLRAFIALVRMHGVGEQPLQERLADAACDLDAPSASRDAPAFLPTGRGQFFRCAAVPRRVCYADGIRGESFPAGARCRPFSCPRRARA